MMTASEILNEIYRLPLGEQNKIKQKLLEDFENGESAKPKMSEDEFLQMLLREGLLANIPQNYTDEDDDFEPIEIEGEPISEMIIRERR